MNNQPQTLCGGAAKAYCHAFAELCKRDRAPNRSGTFVYMTLAMLVAIGQLTMLQACEILDATLAQPHAKCLDCERLNAIRQELTSRRRLPEICTTN